ncbi:MAG TPA: hypothetical protein VJK05_01750 [archaeon]|nr:hypothetical protein [archaeon]
MNSGNSINSSISIETINSRIDLENLSRETLNKLNEIKKMPLPAFALHEPDLNKLINELKPFKKFKNIVIAGRGGSVTCFESLYNSLKKSDSKKIFLLKSSNPDLIKEIKFKAKPEKTLFIAISKSGSTVDVIENLLSFWNYPKKLIITEKKANPLNEIAEAEKIPVIEHPEIGGRYSIGTSCALAPAFLSGLKIKKIFKGLKAGWKEFSSRKKLNQNSALRLAVALTELNKLNNLSKLNSNYSQVFTSIYSPHLNSFSELIMQLMHESTGKNGKGLSFMCFEAPQSQHHSNQLFFGGPKNFIGLFVKLKEFNSDEAIQVPEKLKKISLIKAELNFLNGLKLSKAIEAEFIAVKETSLKKEIPFTVIELEKINEFNIGFFSAFLQYLAVYCSMLLNVNPFDQPNVEESKKLSFELKKKKNLFKNKNLIENK